MIIEPWAFPVGVLIGYILVLLFDKPEKEGIGFVFGVWMMYLITIFLTNT